MPASRAGVATAAIALGVVSAVLLVATGWLTPQPRSATLLQYPYGQPGWKKLPFPFANNGPTETLIRRQPVGAMAPLRVPRLAVLQGQPNVFVGSMLCAEGETSCEHPCSAFHTITESDTDCHCKCTVNPQSFAKDDVICTCPDAPIDPANDQYPWPEGEGWEQPEEEEDVPVPEGETEVPEEDEEVPVEGEEGESTEGQTTEPPAETSEESTEVPQVQTRGMGGVALSAMRRPRFAALQGQPNVFVGSMLCAEGETSCEHPCSAFHTITESDTDCHCKCTVNPQSFAKDDVICTCPDAPIDPANDQYPWPEGEGWEQPEEEEDVPVPEGETEVPEEDEEAPVEGEEGESTDGQTTEPSTATEDTAEFGTQTRALGPMALAAQRIRRGRSQLRGVPMQQPQPYPYAQFDSYAPAPFLPPDGDYPGGSTGIPMDGYIGFETGHGSEPYHGTYAPMQDAGIAYGRRTGGLVQTRQRSEIERGAVMPPWA